MNKNNRLRIKQAKQAKTAAAEVNAGQTNGHQPQTTQLKLNHGIEQAAVDPAPGYQVVKASVSFLTADPDAILNTRTTNIVYSLDDNAPFATLAADLPPITAANDIFADAMAAAADGGKTLNSAKRAARGALVSLLRPLATKVQLLCQNNMTILLSSGFPVQKPNRTPAQVPATPVTPTISQGLTGQALRPAGSTAPISTTGG